METGRDNGQPSATVRLVRLTLTMMRGTKPVKRLLQWIPVTTLCNKAARLSRSVEDPPAYSRRRTWRGAVPPQIEGLLSLLLSE